LTKKTKLAQLTVVVMLSGREMTLYQWIKLHSMTYGQFAQLCGAKDNSVVHKWCASGALPRKSMMMKIFHLTDGQVTPNDFFALPGTPDKQGGRS
jgi:hypothetical protein